MQHSTFMAVLFGVVALLVSATTASVISCPPNLQDAPPKLRQLCMAIEQAISENSVPQDQYGRLEERNVNGNAKRQDVDHVFLRFGRPYGL